MLSFLRTTCSETPRTEYQTDGTTLFIVDKSYGLTDNNISASLAFSTIRLVISAHTGRTVFIDCTWNYSVTLFTISPSSDGVQEIPVHLKCLFKNTRGPGYKKQFWLLPRNLHFYSKLTFILRRSRTGTVWFYTSTSNKRAARPKLYTKSLTRDLKRMYSRLTLVRISINL